MKNSLFDEVEYLAFEGTSLTILGLIRYDPTRDCFEVGELTATLAGGMRDVREILLGHVTALGR